MDVSTESILGNSDDKEIIDGLEFPVEVEEALKEVTFLTIFCTKYNIILSILFFCNLKFLFIL